MEWNPTGNLCEFPAHAGMNRWEPSTRHTARRVPRTRGDEPWTNVGRGCEADEFPAHAGMNRIAPSHTPNRARVPRTRGDEP